MNELNSVVLSGVGAITAHGDFSLNGGLWTQGEVTPAARLPIENFKLENYLSSQKTYLDRCSALALAGAAFALRDAGITLPLPDAIEASAGADDTGNSLNAHSFGITLGTHLGCVETMKGFWDKTAPNVRSASPLLFSHSYFNSPISLCAIEFGLKGYHTTCCAGEESGFEAVRLAFDAIRLGHATTMLCGGVEALTPARELFEPAEGISEAAVFFVLEEQRSATRRGVTRQRSIDDEILTDASQYDEVTQNTFGACGGATGALRLLRALAA